MNQEDQEDCLEDSPETSPEQIQAQAASEYQKDATSSGLLQPEDL